MDKKMKKQMAQKMSPKEKKAMNKEMYPAKKAKKGKY